MNFQGNNQPIPSINNQSQNQGFVPGFTGNFASTANGAMNLPVSEQVRVSVLKCFAETLERHGEFTRERAMEIAASLEKSVFSSTSGLESYQNSCKSNLVHLQKTCLERQQKNKQDLIALQQARLQQAQQAPNFGLNQALQFQALQRGNVQMAFNMQSQTPTPQNTGSNISLQKNSLVSPFLPRNHLLDLSNRASGNLTSPSVGNPLATKSPFLSQGVQGLSNPTTLMGGVNSDTSSQLKNGATGLDSKPPVSEKAPHANLSSQPSPFPHPSLKIKIDSTPTVSQEDLKAQFFKQVEEASVQISKYVKSFPEYPNPPSFITCSQEDKVQIYTFLQKLPEFFKKLDHILPYTVVITQKLDMVKRLVLMKKMLSFQYQSQPNIFLSLDNITACERDLGTVYSLVQKGFTQYLQQGPPKVSTAPLSTSALPSAPTKSHNTLISNPSPNTTAGPVKLPAAITSSQVLNHVSSLQVAIAHNPLQKDDVASSSVKAQVLPQAIENVNSSLWRHEEKKVPPCQASHPIENVKRVCMPLTKAELLEAKLTARRAEFKGKSIEYATKAFQELKAVFDKPAMDSNLSKKAAAADISPNSSVNNKYVLGNLLKQRSCRTFGFGDLKPNV